MPATARDRQISVRIARETDAWLERRAGGSRNKAGFVRRLAGIGIRASVVRGIAGVVRAGCRGCAPAG